MVGAIIGAVAAIAGGAMQAKGASDAAQGSKNAAYAAKLAMERYTTRAQEAVLGYEKEKLQSLSDIGGVLDRYGEGAFGIDTSTQKNLRTSQEKFSELAAGDFGSFEALLRTTIKDSLAGSVSSPIGAFTNISALNQFELMTRGAQASSELTGLFDTMSRNLLGMEFGIMDQSFTNYWNLEGEKVKAINAYITGAAQSAGTGLMAAGAAVSNAGAAIGKVYSAYNSNLSAQTAAAPRAINIQTQQPYAYNYGGIVGNTITPASSGYNPSGGSGASRSMIGSSQPAIPEDNGTAWTDPSLFWQQGEGGDPTLNAPPGWEPPRSDSTYMAEDIRNQYPGFFGP